MNAKTITLWVAYVILVVTSWWGLASIQGDLRNLQEDVCRAIALDLEVQAAVVEDVDPEGAAAIRVVVDEIEGGCAT